jgi:mRNA interferase RelE/StbE
MDCYNIIIKASAKKELSALPKPIISRLIHAIETLATDPRPNGVRKLAGVQNIYRVRVSDYRIVYRIEDDKLIIEVIRVAHRKDAYSKDKS